MNTCSGRATVQWVVSLPCLERILEFGANGNDLASFLGGHFTKKASCRKGQSYGREQGLSSVYASKVLSGSDILTYFLSGFHYRQLRGVIARCWIRMSIGLVIRESELCS